MQTGGIIDEETFDKVSFLDTQTFGNDDQPNANTVNNITM
jgi:hypothetical protein